MEKSRYQPPKTLAADLEALQKELLARFEKRRPTGEAALARPSQAMQGPSIVVRGK